MSNSIDRSSSRRLAESSLGGQSCFLRLDRLCHRLAQVQLWLRRSCRFLHLLSVQPFLATVGAPGLTGQDILESKLDVARVKSRGLDKRKVVLAYAHKHDQHSHSTPDLITLLNTHLQTAWPPP